MSGAFVSLASSLARGDDVVDLLSTLTSHCARILDVSSAGLMLADVRGELHVMAASSEQTRQLEVFQLQSAQGPCRDCYRSGAPVSVPDLAQAGQRWPQFVPAALVAGFASVHAVPMRLRDTVLGTLGLFGTTVGPLNEQDLSLGQALADVASVAVVQERAATDQSALTSQLQAALSSRVVLEQAKGVIAQTGGVDMEQAFALLRRYARDHNLRLAGLSQAVVARTLPGKRLIDDVTARHPGRT